LRTCSTAALGELLAELTLVIVPLYNPDGNDSARSGETASSTSTTHRAVAAPLLVGTRLNAGGINLNRD